MFTTAPGTPGTITVRVFSDTGSDLGLNTMPEHATPGLKGAADALDSLADLGSSWKPEPGYEIPMMLLTRGRLKS